MAGTRFHPATVDMHDFRRTIEAAGAVYDRPREDSGEVVRFRIGNAFGLVTKRKDGTLTFVGAAKPMVSRLLAADAPPPVRRVAEVRTITLRAEEHQHGRAILADATEAQVYTDGSCEYRGLGKGGWAAVIRAGFDTVEIYGGAARTTVNRMELIAAIAALELLPATCAVRLFTDSQYLRKGIKKWIIGWKANGWMTIAREPVKNEELWRRLDGLREGRKVTWKWVKGHRGNVGNERADALARQGRLSIDATKGEAA